MSAPRRLLPRLLPLLILAAAAGGFLWLRETRPEPEPVQPAERRWPVAAATAHRGDWQPAVSLLGRVDSPARPTLTAAVAARVEAVPAREGSAVAQGVLLVRLEPVDYRLQVRQREAELAEVEARLASEEARHRADREALAREEALAALARRAVTRAEDLETRRAGSEAGVDAARETAESRLLALVARRRALEEHAARVARLEAERARARALLDRARQDLARTRIDAPFAARVTAVHVAAGDRVRPGDPLVELVDPGRLEVHAQIPTRHQATVAAHLADGGTLAAQGHLAGGRVPLTLTRLAGAIAPGSGGIAGILEPAADTGYLPVGQSLTVTLRLPPLPGTLRLPREALYGSDKVYRVDGGALEAVPVQVLGRVERPGGGDAVIVASDELADGDRVAATQLPNAIEGLPVRVLPGTGAGAEGP